MDLIKVDDFLEWARQQGVGLDTRYAPPQCLIFTHGRGDSRFWGTGKTPRERLYTIASLMQALDPWERAWVWKRDPVWSFLLEDDLQESRYVWSIQHVWASIVHGLGIPQDFEGAIRFGWTEFHALATLLFTQVLFAGNVTDDLFVVPDHARQIIMISHHDVVHVDFADESRVASFVDDLAKNDVRLPDHPPDWTFKIPHWMKKQESPVTNEGCS